MAMWQAIQVALFQRPNHGVHQMDSSFCGFIWDNILKIKTVFAQMKQYILLVIFFIKIWIYFVHGPWSCIFSPRKFNVVFSLSLFSPFSIWVDVDVVFLLSSFPIGSSCPCSSSLYNALCILDGSLSSARFINLMFNLHHASSNTWMPAFFPFTLLLDYIKNSIILKPSFLSWY